MRGEARGQLGLTVTPAGAAVQTLVNVQKQKEPWRVEGASRWAALGGTEVGGFERGSGDTRGRVSTKLGPRTARNALPVALAIPCLHSGPVRWDACPESWATGGALRASAHLASCRLWPTAGASRQSAG